MEWHMLRSLTPEERRRLLAEARPRRFARREVLFHEGDRGESLYLIRSGRVAVRVVTENGDAVTLTVLGPGDTVGELAVIGDSERTATVLALEPTEALVLSRSQLNALRARHPAVDRLLLDVLAAQVHRLTDQVVEALYVPVRHRVARRLLALADQYAAAAPVVLPITQEDLAGLAGATRPTVNQVLRALEADGAVGLHRGRIEILDREALRRRRG